jgi:hypothetical protein
MRVFAGFRSGVGNSDTETGLQHERNVVEVVADVGDFESVHESMVENLGKGFLLFFTALNDERHAKSLSTFLYCSRSSS